MKLGRLNNILLLLFLSFLAKGQVSGHIYSSVTKESLPFCNIVCKSTNIGTITDLDGGFEITAKQGSKLNISFIGYKSKEIIVDNTNVGSIYLDLQSNMIAEVRVVMKEDPAVTLMKEVIKRKQLLRPLGNVKGMEVQALSKVYLSDPNHKFIGLKKSKLFVKMTDDMISGVPFYISEKRLFNDSLISQKDYGVGIEHDFFVDYINSLNFDFDIYDDLINVMGRSVTSPISTNAFSFYKYYLIDSCFLSNSYCYKVKLTKKRKGDAVLLGDIWIEKKSFLVKKIDVSLENKYINLLEGFRFSQSFDKKEGVIFESSNSIEFTISTADLPFISDSISLRINKQIRRYEFKENKSIKDSILNSEDILFEIAIIDSLNNDPHIKLIAQLGELFITSYYTIGKIDVGPIYNMYSSNKVEGKRPSILFRTNKYFMNNLLISNYIGYGTSDNRYKYGVELKIRDKEKRSLELSLSYKNYIESIGDKYIYRAIRPNLFEASGNDVFTSLFSGMQKNKMFYFTQSRASVKKEFGNLDVSTYFSDKRIEKNINLLVNNDIRHSTVGFAFRFSKSKKLKNHFNTFNVKSTAPLFSGDIAISDKQYFSTDYNIIKAKFIVRQNVNTTFLGRTRYVLDMGYYKTSDNTPLIFLEYHRGNESYIYDLTKSSLMNQNEFVSDRYVAFYLDQHLNGRIFNHIPLLNRLEIRETITTNIVLGNLHNTSLSNNLPDRTHALNYSIPYVEVGIGVENILKLIRINFIWRLTYLDKPESVPFGVTGGIYFSL
tara:strand:- start:10322 stop:12640 length:2319 start_codon:yes stop_codon:yes gene_type:complete